MDNAAKHRDPVTGDELTTGEWISWQVQGVIRRWEFILIVTAISVVVWIIALVVPFVQGEALTWWNVLASYLAILIESVVGLAMFNQTRRDALIIRHILTLTAAHEQLQKDIYALLQREQQQLTAIEIELEEQHL